MSSDKPKRILIVEDEEQIARFVELELSYEGYEVVKAFDGRQGLEVFSSSNFDLVLLDIMLPKLSGLEVLRRIRYANKDIPVIMLTARDSLEDKVSGLDLGSNDYVTKPFDIEELLARIRVALRQKASSGVQESESDENVLMLGDIKLSLSSYSVKVCDEPVTLTKREFELLHYLLLNRETVITRENILTEVWGYDYQGETNVVDVYIRYLRSKIDDRFGIKTIFTVRGVGYVMKDGK